METKHRGAGRGKLDSERDAVEMPTNRPDRGQVFRVRREIRIQNPRPGDKQLHRTMPQNVAWLCAKPHRDIEWRNAIDIFPLDPQGFLARCDHGRARTQVYDRFHQLGRRVDEMLAIVEHQQELLFADGPRDGFGMSLITTQPQAESACHRG